MSDLSITLITPTYNSERYLEATIESVLAQAYPHLEYMIVDGASTDSTLDIIRRYEQHLTWWTSEPDNGIYDALQKGFARSTGQVMGWLNSDDMLLSGTLHNVRQIFQQLPQVQWISSLRPTYIDVDDKIVDCMVLSGFSREAFRRGEYLNSQPRVGIIQQESTFWRRELWQKAGGSLDTSLKLAGDFDLWARFYQHAELVGVRTVLGGFRAHGEQLSAQQRDAYWQEATDSLARHFPSSALDAVQRQMHHALGVRFPRRLRRIAHELGWLYAAQTCYYDTSARQWRLRRDYF